MRKMCKESNNADKGKLQEESQKNHKIPENKGITLIALVITVIVLLILAGVSIAMLTGENGILTKAVDAGNKTNKASVVEQARADILAEQIENKNGKVTAEQLQEVLKEYFNGVPDTIKDLEEKLKDKEFSLKANEKYGGEKVEVKVSEIYGGELDSGTVEEGPEADKATSYVGCYADFLKADGTEGADGIPDGIIYADLAVGENDGQWNGDDDSKYSYEQVTEGLKSYTVGDKVTSDKFGELEAEIISVKKGSEGADRFYVMALEDLDESAHYWYYNASGKLDNLEESKVKISFKDSNGKTNTTEMIQKYKDSKYGQPYENGEYTDLWGMDTLATKVAEEWFVPSRAEWSAFGDMLYTVLKMPKSDYTKYKLKASYWSSSQHITYGAWNAYFGHGYMGNFIVYGGSSVRLSTTF